MDRPRPVSGWRASAFAVALFAITLNFLQPLAHAALMRDGALSTLWSVFCSGATADPAAEKGSSPVMADAHECCLGLAHAAAFTEPTAAFVILTPTTTPVVLLETIEQPSSVAIRDGPTRPRGPPTLA